MLCYQYSVCVRECSCTEIIIGHNSLMCIAHFIHCCFPFKHNDSPITPPLPLSCLFFFLSLFFRMTPTRRTSHSLMHDYTCSGYFLLLPNYTGCPMNPLIDTVMQTKLFFEHRPSSIQLLLIHSLSLSSEP